MLALYRDHVEILVLGFSVPEERGQPWDVAPISEIKNCLVFAVEPLNGSVFSF